MVLACPALATIILLFCLRLRCVSRLLFAAFCCLNACICPFLFLYCYDSLSHGRRNLKVTLYNFVRASLFTLVACVSKSILLMVVFLVCRVLRFRFSCSPVSFTLAFLFFLVVKRILAFSSILRSVHFFLRFCPCMRSVLYF